MVIFGAAGDLTRRKLIPALYNLAKQQLLSREFAVVGVARRRCPTEEFRKKVSEDIKEFATERTWIQMSGTGSSSRIYYVTGDFDDQDLYATAEGIARQGRQRPHHPRQLFFLSGDRPRFLRADRRKTWRPPGLMDRDNGHWRRVIVEKPFGHDLESAKPLNQQL